MKNIEVSIQITIKPTDAGVSRDNKVTKVEDGHFRLVFDEGIRFDTDALKGRVLHVTYPTLRDALAHALETATLERATAVGSQKGGPIKGSAAPERLRGRWRGRALSVWSVRCRGCRR